MDIKTSLISLLFGAIAGEVVAISPRLKRWDETFQVWLVRVETAGGRQAANQARQSWNLLLDFQRCPPWQLDRPKMEAWLDHLAKSGMTPCTIRHYRGRISSFFNFCAKYPAMQTDPLFGPGKPANPMREIASPQAGQYEVAYVLRPDEARCLLRAVDRQASPASRRDYAFLLTLLLTGTPVQELCQLRWGELHPSANLETAELGDQPLPGAAWTAMREYLEASGRLATIQAEDFVFAPLADPLLQPSGRQSKDWAAWRPMSSAGFRVRIRNYAAWAGLDTPHLTHYALRHSATALRLEAGDDEADLQRFLNRAKIERNTRQYLTLVGQALQKRGRPRRPWQPRAPSASANRRRAVALRAIRYGPLLRKQAGSQPGNLNSFKHGFYYRYLLPGELDEIDPDRLLAEHLENEIVALRLLLSRVWDVSFREDARVDPVQMLNMAGVSAIRIMRLMMRQRELKSGPLPGARPRSGSRPLSGAEAQDLLQNMLESMKKAGLLTDDEDEEDDQGLRS